MKTKTKYDELIEEMKRARSYSQTDWLLRVYGLWEPPEIYKGPNNNPHRGTWTPGLWKTPAARASTSRDRCLFGGCAYCQEKGKLNAHHLHYRSCLLGGESVWDYLSLCELCHTKCHYLVSEKGIKTRYCGDDTEFMVVKKWRNLTEQQKEEKRKERQPIFTRLNLELTRKPKLLKWFQPYPESLQ